MRPRLLLPLTIAGMAVIVAAVAFIVVTVVQEVTEPDSGRVTAKTYHAAWWSTSCHKSGKIMICVPTHHPECYEIEYVNGGDDGDACVAAPEYDRIQIGSWYGSEGS